MGLVLNCAGPFSATAAAMMAACLAAHAHYLDITGEISVFEHARTLGAAARAARIVICPGVGELLQLRPGGVAIGGSGAA